MLDPRQYDYDPAIMEAHRATQDASKPADLNFWEGVTGGHETFSTWASSGLLGQMISKGFSDDTEADWFVQRHAIDFGYTELDNQIKAMNVEAKLRPLDNTEQAYLNQMIKDRDDIKSGLLQAKEYYGGNLDAKIYKDGKSFNQKWGMGDEDAIGLGEFWDVLKANPTYTLGAITGELIKDLPLSVLAWLGVTKISSVANTAKALRAKLTAIRPGYLRFGAYAGTGTTVGAAAGAGYEALYSQLDEGTFQEDNIWMGAKFGGLFGLLGGMASAATSSKISMTGEVSAETIAGPLGDIGKAGKQGGKVNSREANTLMSNIAKIAEDEEELITKQAEGLDILPQFKQYEQPGKGAPETLLSENTDKGFITKIDDAYTEKQRKALLAELEDMLSKGPESRGAFRSVNLKDMSLRDVVNLRNPTAYRAMVKSHQKARGSLMLKNKLEGRKNPEALTSKQEVEARAIAKRELDLSDKRIKQTLTTERNKLLKQHEADLDANAPGQAEAQRIITEQERRTGLHTELKTLSSQKNLTPEEQLRLTQVNEELRAIDELETVDKVATSKTADWISRNPYKALGIGAVAGATLVPGEDTFFNTVAGAGIAFGGAKAYKAITNRAFNQAAMRIKGNVIKNIPQSERELKVFEYKMEQAVTDMEELFKGSKLGRHLINYLETSNPKFKGVTLSDSQIEAAKGIRRVLDTIGLAAEDAGILKKGGLTKGNFKKGERGAFLHNYFPHLFNKKMTDEDMQLLVKKWGDANPKSGLERTILGTIEYIEEFHGHLGIITDPSKALSLYVQAMTKAIHGKRILNDLANEVNLSMDVKKYTPALMSDDAFQILKKQGKLTDQQASHYQTFDHNSLEGYRVHTDVKNLVDSHFDYIRKGTYSEIMESVLQINNGLKRIFVFGSLFHAQALVTSLAYSLGIKGVFHGLRGKGLLIEGSGKGPFPEGHMWTQLQLDSGPFRERVEYMIGHGLQVINIKKQELVNSGYKPVEQVLDGMGKWGLVPKKGFEAIDKITWSQAHDRFKLATALLKQEKLMRNGMDEVTAGRLSAKFSNDAYGSLDWAEFAAKLTEYAVANPNKLRGKIAGATAEMLPIRHRKKLNLFLFAPDWTISNLRIVGRMFTIGGHLLANKLHRGDDVAWNSPKGKEMIAAWNMYAAYSARAAVINSALWWTTMELFSDEEPTFEKLDDFWFGPASHKVDLGGGDSVVISKQIAEPIHWVQHPMHTFSNKMSVMPKTVAELFLNKRWFSLKNEIPTGPSLWDKDGSHHAQWLFGKVTPIVIKPMFQFDLPLAERMERVLTGGLGFPQYTIKE
jgi:ElaB/YqjD/DUF883 family membrane-anchored ribosome-binding protein